MDAVYNNSYIWNLISQLNVEQKLSLISKLSESVSSTLISAKPKAKTKNPLASSFGAWDVDEDKYPTKALLEDINAMMTDQNDFIVELYNRDSNGNK